MRTIIPIQTKPLKVNMMQFQLIYQRIRTLLMIFMLPHYHRTHFSMGQIKKSMLDYCTRAFYQEFHFSEPYPSLEALSTLYRRLLAIYRWKMFKPQILFIEGLSIGLDLAGEQIIFEYLKKCSQEGNIIFIMSNRQELLQKHCSQVVITQNTKLLQAT